MHHSVTFNFGSIKVYAPAILETCFSYDKNMWIAPTDYYNIMYFNIIVLLVLLFFPLTSILQELCY